MSRIEFKVNEKQKQDLDELKTRTLLKPVGRVRRPRIRKRDPNHIPRPVNSFLAYRTEMQAIIRNHCPLANHREISKIVAKWWHEATNEEKQVFKDKAEAAKYIHTQMYPDYKFNPKKKKPNNTKKPNKKSDTTIPKKVESNEITVSSDTFHILDVSTFEENKPLQDMYPNMYQSNDTMLQQENEQLPDYMPHETYDSSFKYELLDNPINDGRFTRMNNLHPDYVLINEPTSFYCYNTPLMTYCDLTPTSQPLLTPEPEYSYMSLASSSVSPYLIPTENYWYNQLHYY